ncbi:hypothetical protein U1Q18_044583 [Sarracenia purpurea var. burkii]
MEAFSNHHHPSFLLDTVFQPTTTAAAATTTTTTAAATCFSQFYFPESLEEIPVDLSIYESSCLENEENGTKKDEREVKGKKAKKCNGGVVKKGEKEKKTRGGGNYKIKEDLEIISEDKKVPTEYVYVRARRGKATSKHSLAERVRRQKISERMNHLQALVPGCDQVTGKLLLLDHIINYVQSLQNQVERRFSPKVGSRGARIRGTTLTSLSRSSGEQATVFLGSSPAAAAISGAEELQKERAVIQCVTTYGIKFENGILITKRKRRCYFLSELQWIITDGALINEILGGDFGEGVIRRVPQRQSRESSEWR